MIYLCSYAQRGGSTLVKWSQYAMLCCEIVLWSRGTDSWVVVCLFGCLRWGRGRVSLRQTGGLCSLFGIRESKVAGEFVSCPRSRCCYYYSVLFVMAARWPVTMLTILQPHGEQGGVLDEIDHLFLLPERALTMDSSRLQKDLAGLDFDPQLMHAAPMGNVWLCESSNFRRIIEKVILKNLQYTIYSQFSSLPGLDYIIIIAS